MDPLGILTFISIVLPAGKPYLAATITALKSLGHDPHRYSRLPVNDEPKIAPDHAWA